MKTSSRVKVLTEDELNYLGRYFKIVTYNRDTNLFYQGHVPHVGHVLLEGEMTVVKKSTPLFKLPKGSVIGVKELCHGLPFPLQLQVKKETEVVLMDRSSIEEVLAIGERPLQMIMQEIMGRDEPF